MHLANIQQSKSHYGFTYRSGACIEAMLLTISNSQSNESIGWGSTREPCI